MMLVLLSSGEVASRRLGPRDALGPWLEMDVEAFVKRNGFREA